MFAPMSKGGSDDAWQAQDEAGSLKPGRFRAYLPDQVGSPPVSSSLAARPIPFPREDQTKANREARRRAPPPSNAKGKSKAKNKGKERALSSDHIYDEPQASTSLGTRFAAGFGFRTAAKTAQSRQPDLLGGPGAFRGRSSADAVSNFRSFFPGATAQPSSIRSQFGNDTRSSLHSAALGPSPFQSPPAPPIRRKRVISIRERQWERERERERRRDKHWLYNLIRPSRDMVEDWLDSWWKRWFALAGLPSLVVWFWCAVPFPKTDPYDPNLPWCNPGDHNGNTTDPTNPPWCTPSHHSPSMSSATSFLTPQADRSSAAIALLARLPTLTGGAWFIVQKLFAWLSMSTGYTTAFASTNATTPPMDGSEHLTVDANFWFFLIFYYGIYVGVALIYITQLFGLYRLNWWPAALGAKTSYTFFWVGSLIAGYVLHELDPLGSETSHRPPQPGEPFASTNVTHPSSSGSSWFSLPSLPAATTLRAWSTVSLSTAAAPGTIDDADIQWQRKTLWVGLAFATMAMPALVCFVGLRRSGRQTYRHSLTDHQKTFLERQLNRRIPSSYIRFLWFMSTIGLSLFALIAGQGYASVYLSTLPHTGLDGVAYVSFWTLTVNGLALVSHWILEDKVRSRALVFVFKYYYFLVYFIFYRNLFARLRSVDQFALIQLLSSFWVCIWYPFSMSGFCHRVVQYFNPSPRSWEEYVEGVGLAFYLRNLAQNTTMLAFLGWVSILHFGSNQPLYPFFAYDNKHDPYNYQLTMLGSLAIWGSELLSSFVARQICYFAYRVDVTNLGLDEMREFPELLPTISWAAVHTLMDMLLFLIKLNFR
ncbi:hypothetical protein BCV70DRAFT_198486 [Testicularia cyperi]|uniref:Uncharacterized protein n=1 Tax=Testicularia cyperi TaxID=1882483 RepID=A0A317XWC0_9BASI|nr:hypothetical protein BCV70DRAFT_198486 [Testicularia cyperi]